MTTYTAIPNADIDVDSPLSAALMALIRDNPLAIAEGDPTAPDILAGAISSPFGDKGTYAFAHSHYSNGPDNAGDTRPGSQLSRSGVYGGEGANVEPGSLVDVGSLAGSWRCMGDSNAVDGDANTRTSVSTLWLRIS